MGMAGEEMQSPQLQMEKEERERRGISITSRSVASVDRSNELFTAPSFVSGSLKWHWAAAAAVGKGKRSNSLL